MTSSATCWTGSWLYILTTGYRTELRRFLGFAGFYRRFVRGFSQVAAPLHALTSTKTTFTWCPEAEAAFQDLKQCFAPVLAHPDTDRPFVVEVDASNSGIRAVPSQRAAEDEKPHPCAFFSRRLSPAETNYDAGNRKLLAVLPSPNGVIGSRGPSTRSSS